MLSFLPKTPSQVQDALKTKFKTRRKTMKLTQEELSTRAGVSLGSLKRFEQSGQIALESLLKLAFVLECLGDFEGVCGESEEKFGSMDDILFEEKGKDKKCQ